MDKELEDWYQQGLIKKTQGEDKEAIELFTKILIRKPELAKVWNERGAALQHAGHPFDARLNYEKAVEHDPDSGIPLNNLGSAWAELEIFDKSLDYYQAAISKDSSLYVAHHNYASILARTNRVEEAVEAYRKAVAVKGDYADAHFGLGLSLLKLGQYEEGWKEYEWRWKTEQLKARDLPYPEWDGAVAESEEKVLLLYAEQGAGDAIQFLRYAPVAKKFWGGKVYIEVRLQLMRLAKTMTGVDGVITIGEKPPENTVAVAPLMSLPRILWPVSKTIPTQCPYLYPDEYLAGLWQGYLKAMPSGMLVGVCWAGMSRESPYLKDIDRRRSIALIDFTAPAKIPGVTWVSLQTGPPREQIYQPPSGMSIGDWVENFNDYYDTAALISILDLVITVDTSVAHLAGALGKPVWMLNRFDACWRWLKDREDTPWYPTMKLYNQKKPHVWGEVMERVATDLHKLLRERNSLSHVSKIRQVS